MTTEEEKIAWEKIKAGVNQIEENYKKRKELESQIEDINRSVVSTAKIFVDKYIDDVFNYIVENNNQVRYDDVVNKFINIMPERAINLTLHRLVFKCRKVDQRIKSIDDCVYFYSVRDRCDWQHLDSEFVEDYCEKHLINKDYITDVVKCVETYHIFTIYMLKFAIQKMNEDNMNIHDVVKYFNVNPDTEEL